MELERKPYHHIRAYGAVGSLRVGRRKAPPSKFFSSRTPGQIKKNVAVNPAGVVIKARMEAYHEGSKALVRRHTTCVPIRPNRRFTRVGAWRVRCGQLLKHPFISGISPARARLEKF
jgi:hypothetical protein